MYSTNSTGNMSALVSNASSGGEQAQTFVIERQATNHQRRVVRTSTGTSAGNNSNNNSNSNNYSNSNNNSNGPNNGLISNNSGRGRSNSAAECWENNGGFSRTLAPPASVSSSGRGPIIIGPLFRPNSTNSFGNASNYGSNNELRALLGNGNNGSKQSYLTSDDQPRTIRFQVVIWNIGGLDVVTGNVQMTFRVSLFWDDTNPDRDELLSMDDGSSANLLSVWKMHGRQKAFQQELKDIPVRAIDVPPLSILNVSSFTVIGTPDVTMLNEDTRLMRWSCMYRATVIQEDLRVHEFPHDSHEVALKLAILSQRGKGRQWDRRYWRLALATAEDNQQSTRVPHGLIVDSVRVPDFQYNKDRGLDFQFCSLAHGSFDDRSHDAEAADVYLKVSLTVLRESGYYDKNIIPLLALLNTVAVSVLALQDTEFFQRGLLTLNIAFVEMSIRFTNDRHLPSVGYEIRLQRILNEFFFVLMLLVLEAMTVYVLSVYHGYPPSITKWLDWFMGIFAITHNIVTCSRYYDSRRRAVQNLQHGWGKKDA